MLTEHLTACKKAFLFPHIFCLFMDKKMCMELEKFITPFLGVSLATKNLTFLNSQAYLKIHSIPKCDYFYYDQ